LNRLSLRLDCRPMNIYVRFVWLGSALLLLLGSLYLEISVIAEIARENKQRKSKANERPRQPDDSLGLNFCSNRQSAQERSKASRGSRYRGYVRPIRCAQSFLKNVRKDFTNFLSQLLVGLIKPALVQFFGGFRRHRPSLARELWNYHTESRATRGDWCWGWFDPNTLRYYMTYIV
jgi:hypothetical protein